jgi:transcriptional regulator with XRE-family HTH domain
VLIGGRVDNNIEMIDEPKKLGELIRKRRKEMKITQKEIAQYCDLSHTGIGKIEMGTTDVKISTLLKLFKILGIKINLMFEE